MKRYPAKTIPFVTALSLLFLSMLALSPISHAATLTVTTLVDENGTCADGEGCSLREAIQEANPGDEIVFSVDGFIRLDSEKMVIDKDLTITGSDGAPVVLDGRSTYSIFDITSDSTVVIHGIIFKNCYAAGDGGCIWSDGDTTINYCTLRQSQSDAMGGAIYSQGPNLALNYCLIEDNVAEHGGALCVNTGSASLTDCIFQNNEAQTYAGAFYSYLADEISVNRCEFSGNSATSGGAIYVNEADFDLVNTTLSGNTATFDGGGIFVDTAHSNVDISFCTIADNSVQGKGGGLYENGHTRIKNSIVSDNHDTNDSILSPDIDGGTVDYAGTVLVSDMNGAALQLIEGATGTLIQGQSALLGPLADNGGRGQTHALIEGSPALGVADDSSTLGGEAITTDQRGSTRPQGDPTADIGAYESDLFASYEPKYTGWWWQGADYSGTGISIEDQDYRIYLAWYGYDETGQPVWYSALTQLSGTYAGDLVRYTGWPLENDNPAAGYQGETVGTLEIAFTNTEHAVLNYSIDGVDYTKDLVRYWDGERDARAIHGWWYDPAYDGMGVFLEARDGQLFGSWYHYRGDESPRWWITLGALGAEDTSYTGPLGEYSSGQTLTGDYQPAALEDATKGPVQIDFLGDDQASMTWQGITYDLERFDFTP